MSQFSYTVGSYELIPTGHSFVVMDRDPERTRKTPVIGVIDLDHRAHTLSRRDARNVSEALTTDATSHRDASRIKAVLDRGEPKVSPLSIRQNLRIDIDETSYEFMAVISDHQSIRLTTNGGHRVLSARKDGEATIIMGVAPAGLLQAVVDHPSVVPDVAQLVRSVQRDMGV